MRHITAVFVCASLAAHSQTLYISQFGAVGDGLTNDQAAFEAASSYIASLGGNCELVIEAGTYIVGHQYGDAANYLTNKPIVHLLGLSNVTIRGEVDPESGARLSTIKYKDCLKYGTFHPPTGNRLLADGSNACMLVDGSESQLCAELNACIHVEGCDKIAVRDIILNGNSERYIVGGKYGESGIQAEADGLMVKNSKNVTVDNVDANGFGRDGILLFATASFGTGDMHFAMTNSHFDWNGRNAMTWGGGSGASVESCYFGHTAMGYCHSSPGAGLDIEWADGFAPIFYGNFVDCEFIANSQVGVICDHHDEAGRLHNTGHYTFDRCTIVSTSNHTALFPNAQFMRFNNSTIVGFVAPCFDAQLVSDPDAGNQFRACSIRESWNGESITPLAPGCAFLLNSGSHDAGGLVLESCRLEVNATRFVGYYFRGGPNNGPGQNYKAQVKDNSFTYTDPDLVPDVICNCVYTLSAFNLELTGVNTVHRPSGMAVDVSCGSCSGSFSPAVATPTSYPDHVDVIYPHLAVSVACSSNYSCSDPLYHGRPGNNACGAVVPYPCCDADCSCFDVQPPLSCGQILAQEPYHMPLVEVRSGSKLRHTDLVSVFPTLVSDLIYVVVTDTMESDWRYTLMNLMGQNLYSGFLSTGPNTLHAKSVLADGTYILTLWRDGVRYDNVKLMVPR